MTNLTPKQKSVFDFVEGFIAQNQYSPTLREIGTGTGLRSLATVSEYLNRLEKRGWIKREYQQANSIQITRQAKKLAQPKTCPHCGGKL